MNALNCAAVWARVHTVAGAAAAVALLSMPSGCSQLNAESARTMVELARGLGADMKVEGELGPARFGQTFEADLGARLDIEGSTDVGGVTARDLLTVQQQLIDLLAALQHSPLPPAGVPLSDPLPPL